MSPVRMTYHKQADTPGRNIGGTNDQLFDLVEVNPDGTIIEGTARQLKFVGKDAESCAETVAQQKSMTNTAITMFR